jgi:DNA-binding transcriptional regulator YhcF (GntR family)
MKSTVTYKKIADDICDLIEQGKLKQGDTIPSFSQISEKYHVSRDTVVKAYRILKERGIIKSLPGKASFISSTNINFRRKIFIFFDELSLYKSILFNSLKVSLENIHIPYDIYFHHFNGELFNNIIIENQGNYTDFVIMPLYNPLSISLIQELSIKKNVYLLDQGMGYFNHAMPGVYQDFKMDLQGALIKLSTPIAHYKRVIMQMDQAANESEAFITARMKEGFDTFCKIKAIQGDIATELKKPQEGILYIVHNDIELTRLIKHCWDAGLVPGEDIGIISFNETPFKEVMNEGITTISTDFELMGIKIAKLIEGKSRTSLINPFKIYRRQSF